MKTRITGIALLAIGIPLMIYGVLTYTAILGEVGRNNCSLNPVSNLPMCEDATEYGAVFVVGIVVAAAGSGVLIVSRRTKPMATA